VLSVADAVSEPDPVPVPAPVPASVVVLSVVVEAGFVSVEASLLVLVASFVVSLLVVDVSPLLSVVELVESVEDGVLSTVVAFLTSLSGELVVIVSVEAPLLEPASLDFAAAPVSLSTVAVFVVV